jgi:3-oxoacyl-[acyl-carrier protein] reductase
MNVSNQKTALVTGMSKGIGKAICERLVEEGYFVHGTYNSDEAGARAVKQASENIAIYQVDFSVRVQTLDFIKKMSSIQFDAIVNNAGTFFEEDFENFSMEGWDAVLEVNLTTPLLICTSLQNNIKAGGAIVNISSTDGYTGSFGSMAYSASKAGLSNLTKSLANNCATKNIRVNAICPGWINTGMSTEASYKATHLTPLGRNGKPMEIANVVNFLLSEQASFVTGSNMFADGGYTNVDCIMREEAGLVNLRFE